jgi:hypothetical protein
MIFAKRRHGPGSVARSAAKREEAAYVLLEEARLRCAALLARAVRSRERQPLSAIHRELGLAGFFVSESLTSRRRQTALALAHRRCVKAGADVDPLRSLKTLAKRARCAVEDALVALGLSDHVHSRTFMC